jgi:hypothetical protein
MFTPKYDETLVAINRHGPGDYQVIELPRRSTETTQSHQLGSHGEALDLIDENWTEGNYQYVSPQDITDEINARKT